MAGTHFSVDLQYLEAGKETHRHLSADSRGLGPTGWDRAAFMIAPNVGEAAKPLAAIASGGELSRVVLALKVIQADTDALETMVFDEVDAGIGGATADLVGKKLSLLAKTHQVLCITHLPQIACYGDHHFRIEKRVQQERTHTTITPLNSNERIQEIARMLGGEKITATTLAHAKEMLMEQGDIENNCDPNEIKNNEIDLHPATCTDDHPAGRIGHLWPWQGDAAHRPTGCWPSCVCWAACSTSTY